MAKLLILALGLMACTALARDPSDWHHPEVGDSSQVNGGLTGPCAKQCGDHLQCKNACDSYCGSGPSVKCEECAGRNGCASCFKCIFKSDFAGREGSLVDRPPTKEELKEYKADLKKGMTIQAAEKAVRDKENGGKQVYLLNDNNEWSDNQN